MKQQRMAWSRPRAWCLVAALGLVGLPGWAQDPGAEVPPAASPEIPSPVFFESVEVDVATVDVYVTDRQGQPVHGLSRDDFELRVDGTAQPITNFYAESAGTPAAVEWDPGLVEAPAEPEAGAPPEQRLHVVLFVDQTNLSAGNRGRVFDRLEAFVREQLRPEDAVSVVSLGDRLQIHSDFLNDPATVGKILRELRRSGFRDTTGERERRRIFGELSRGQTGSGMSPFRQDPVTGRADAEQNSRLAQAEIRAYASSEYQRTRNSLAALERYLGSLSGVPGRKAMFYVSDGLMNRPGEDLYVAWRNMYGGSADNPNIANFDPNSDYTSWVGHFDLIPELSRVAAAANSAEVTLYTLDAEGDHSTVARSASLEGGTTGIGEVLSIVEANVRDPQEFVSGETGGRRLQASNRLDVDLQRVAADFDSYYSLGFRLERGAQRETLKIEVKLRGEAARGRVLRYRKAHEIKAVDERTADSLLAAVFYNATDNPLGIELVAGEGTPRDDGSSVLPVTVEIPLARAALLPTGQGSDAHLSIFVTVKEASGDARRVQKLPFHLNIPADKVDEALGERAHHILPIVLRPGDQQIAVGVRDEIGGTVSTVRLELPAGR